MMNVAQHSGSETDLPFVSDFADIYRMLAEDAGYAFEVKKADVAVDIQAMMKSAGVSRKELANLLGWKASRVTKILSGEENLTLRTLQDVYWKLGYEYDVVARKIGERRALQPWQRSALRPRLVVGNFTKRVFEKSIPITEQPVTDRYVRASGQWRETSTQQIQLAANA